MSVSGICDDLGQVQVKQVVTSERSIGREGRERMPIYVWEIKITKEYKFKCETEVKIFWVVWGRDCGAHTQQQERERKILYFYHNVLLSVEIT